MGNKASAFKMTRDTVTKTVTYDPIALEVGQAPRYSLVYMHGVGWDAEAFTHFLADRGVDDDFLRPFENCRFVFPNAGKMKVQLYGDREKHSWFDVYRLDTKRDYTELSQIWDDFNQKDLENSADWVFKDVLRREAHELYEGDTSRVFHGGFSQGAFVSLAIHLRHNR
jgi:predicted esterase